MVLSLLKTFICDIMMDKESSNCQERRRSIVKMFCFMEQKFNVSVKKMKRMAIEELT